MISVLLDLLLQLLMTMLKARVKVSHIRREFKNSTCSDDDRPS